VDAADAGDDSGGGSFVVVHAVGGKRRELEERTALVEQAPNPVANQELSALGMTFARVFGSALSNALDFLVKPLDLRLDDFAVFLELRGVGVDSRLDAFHARLPVMPDETD
jgi:hypothetical protein